MISVIFCDDNTEFMNLLALEVKRLLDKSVVKKYDSIAYKCFDNGKTAIIYGKKQPIDVAFLDIDMKDVNGFAVAKALLEQNENILIVFVSAYDQFVYDVFEFSPVAFIRKSRLTEELTRVVGRVVSIIDESNSKIDLNTTDGKVTIKSKDIVYINSIGNYCYIRMEDKTQYVCRDTLSNMENLLVDKGFYRVHSAYIINLYQIQRIERNISVIMGKEQIPVPISQRRNSGFKKAYTDIVVGRMI